jgi:hypothetical protein
MANRCAAGRFRSPGIRRRYPAWGVMALPLRSMLYVREIDVPKLADKYPWEFRTKHQLGVELLTWVVATLRKLGVKTKVWLAVDGAYAARPFLLPVLDLGIVVVSRLRKDACLLICLLRILTATASMARTKSVWPSVPGTAGPARTIGKLG